MLVAHDVRCPDHADYPGVIPPGWPCPACRDVHALTWGELEAVRHRFGGWMILMGELPPGARGRRHLARRLGGLEIYPVSESNLHPGAGAATTTAGCRRGSSHPGLR